MKLYTYDCLPSTNDTAKELVKSNPTQSSFAVLASEQTAGKGQRGNSWASPLGGLYLSIALHDPKLDTAKRLVIDSKRLQIAIQIRQTLKNLCKANTPICIKWPNDFYTIDGKLGGILCETISTCSDWLIVGIGINVVRESHDTVNGISYLEDSFSDKNSTSKVEQTAEALYAMFSNKVG